MLGLAIAGCHHDSKAPTTPVAPNTAPPAAHQDAPPEVASDQKVSHTLAMSGELVQLCSIKRTESAANPKFDYDKDELTTDDRTVLEQLATCMISGALKGKPVALIGRADPRGTEEYNLALGSRRATSVSQYLQRLGVTPAQLPQTTRGALDATGSDEAGWAKDRRVDLQLK
ncbi:MAG TPA: OmpA family protein [Kofleriaceae bacterium]|nr:OmpA family protein [Kofleriaceae bacterium]